MPSIYRNFLAGTVSDAPLSSGAVTINSTAFAGLPVVAAPDWMWMVLDPAGLNGAPELVQVTAHTVSATSVTVVRAQQSTAARAHPAGTVWHVAATQADMDELPFRKMTATGDLLYGSAANTATRLPVGTAGQLLGVAAGVPAWTSVNLSALADVTVSGVANGQTLTWNSSTSRWVNSTPSAKSPATRIFLAQQYR
jgi:hypothetical protein